MSKHRPALIYGQPIPQSFLDAMQEMLGTMASPNLQLTMVAGSANQVQIVAGTGSAQVGLGIDGLWRYITVTISTTVPTGAGSAGTYDIFVTTGDNSFAVNGSPPPPEIDSTNYAFAFNVPLLQGNVPAAAHYRKIGEAVSDGNGHVLSLRQTVGPDGAVLHQTGDLKLSAATSAPAGWLICQGQEVSRTTFAALFAALGGTGSPWGLGAGGVGGSTFNVPDLRGRVPIGAGSGTASDATSHALGTQGGNEGNTLTAAQSGVNGNGGTSVDDRDHTHTVSGNTGGESANHSHGIGGYGGLISVDGSLTQISEAIQAGHTPAIAANNITREAATLTENVGHTHGISFASSGRSTGHFHTLVARAADSAHNNMQPFAACNYLIKT
jgi:microcystin-dependent protein